MLQQEPVNTTQLNAQPKRIALTDSTGSTQIVFFPQVPETESVRSGVQLNYQGPEGRFSFRGTQINQQRSLLGLLITVTLEPDAEAGQLNLTLVLPPINFAGQKAIEFETVAIKTRSQGHVIDPAGAGLFYRVLSLKGVAQAVLLPPIAPNEPVPSTQQSILEITEINLGILASCPPQLDEEAKSTIFIPGTILIPGQY